MFNEKLKFLHIIIYYIKYGIPSLKLGTLQIMSINSYEIFKNN